VGVAFMVLGLFVVDIPRTQALTGGKPEIVASFTIGGGRPFVITAELLHLSIMFGGLASLYLTIAGGLREEFTTFTKGITGALSKVLAAFAYFRNSPHARNK
jgi:hypothetical protein